MKRTTAFKAWGFLLFVAMAGATSAAERPFDFESVKIQARALAASPYVARKSRVPDWLQALTYDQYRRIQFVGERAVWRREGLPFRLELFHPGFINNRTVQVSQVDHGAVTPIPYDSSMFQFGDELQLGPLPADLGFTGFRLLNPLNAENVWDEVAVFQGASYFRALAQGQRYGLSARGLALNTADAGGEEFPVFEQFWLERPTPKARSIVVHALLDSPSVAGAFRFVIAPGGATTMEVKAALFPRAGKTVTTWGLAPLTSMFWHGESSMTVNDDYRPEVHDSDGLLMERGNGEWLWRPLVNPRSVRTVSFSDENPRGFGLVQRDRAFSSYEDLEACYHLRPSAWVEPTGDWGRGQVRLVEIPTPDETNDNIVAFWVPETPLNSYQGFEYSYRLIWFTEGKEGARTSPAGHAVATRLGRSRTHEPDVQRFAIDFDGAYLRTCGPDAGIETVLDVGKGAILVHKTLQKNPFNGTWRVAFGLQPDGSGKPVELRCFLKQPKGVLSETWTFLWQP
ncbi:MAG: glucan biosynthesis protein [Opitutaceae bacterium]|nr:glucan biosynthesis protein [Opitutaceae bacterium]